MRLLSLFLVLVLVLAVPVSAAKITTTGFFPDAEIEYSAENIQDFTFTVNSTRAISNIQFRAPKGTELNYTIFYGAGQSMEGYISYLPGDLDVLGMGQGVTTINIGSSTDSRSFIDTGLLRKWEIVGYAREEEDNGTVLSTGYAIYDVSLGLGNIGFQSGFIAYEPVEDLQPIEGFTFTSTQPVLLEVGTSDREEIQSGISRTVSDEVNEWINLALSMGSLVLGVVLGAIAWLRFFFVDNLLMTVSLYISITMAFSAARAKSIDRFFRVFFSDQKKLFMFILDLWNVLVNIIGTFRSIFRI